MAFAQGKVEISVDEAGTAAGLESLCAEAWAESGRGGSMPPGWRPFGQFGATMLAARVDGQLEAYCVVRPAEGMDSIDFAYARKRARGGPALRSLLERAVEQLDRVGLTKIVYCGFTWWRSAFPQDLADQFHAAGFGRFEGVFLARPMEPGGPIPTRLPPGYEAVEWSDALFDEVCDMMCRTPEPGALYWDMGLCRRSITNAGNPMPPMFRDGLGQIALKAEGGRKRVVGFSLSTGHGYVNHVYTDPAEQGKGLATALITRVLSAQARLGLTRSTILTHETNPRAIALYERLGFRTEFTFPQFHKRRG